MTVPRAAAAPAAVTRGVSHPDGPAARPGPAGEIDDLTLVVRAQEGDVRAFEELVRRHQRPSYRLGVRLLGSTGDAEDAVQEAFVAAWRRLSQFRGEAAFSSWMYRIVTNRCLKLLRQRRLSVPLDAIGETLPGSGQDSPERVVESGDQMSALQRALRRLPTEQRACWVLRELHDLSYAEISSIVGASQDSVRGRIYRARVQLAEVMRPWR